MVLKKLFKVLFEMIQMRDPKKTSCFKITSLHCEMWQKVILKEFSQEKEVLEVIALV
jgi:hypothetical protein